MVPFLDWAHLPTKEVRKRGYLVSSCSMINLFRVSSEGNVPAATCGVSASSMRVTADSL